jgi:MtN3 and saliva related transmembrane protein
VFETVLGVTAAAWGILMAISPALQIRKMLVHRSSREVSVAYFWVLLVGFALWVAYGITIENWYLILPNAVAFTVCSTTIAVALRYRVRPAPAG